MNNLDNIQAHYLALLKEIGEDPTRDGLLDTPKRAAKALQYLTRGYEQDLEEVVNGAIFDSDNDQMVIVKDIEVYSMCEHHLLPFIGKCHIAYLPEGKVIGLSKNAFGVKEQAGNGTVENFSPSIPSSDNKVESVDKVTGKVTIADAEIEVSGGRGLK